MEQIRMLSIEDALELYQRISPHFPENFSKSDTVLSLIDYIINDMKDTEPLDYLVSLMIMTGLSMEELESKDKYEIIDLFAKGIIENSIYELMEFGKFLGM